MCALCRLAVSYSTCATAIVIPRSRSSGALSIDPYSRTAIALFFVCSTFVIAAVNVVLPWSMCPIVPMFTCGFVRSYFAFAITDLRWPQQSSRGQWSPCPGLNRRPRPYQGRALPTELHGRTKNSRAQNSWSGKRDSNPRPPAWKAGALPLSYSRPSESRVRQPRWWGGEDLNPRRRTPADLQSAPFGHLGTSPNPPARDENPSNLKCIARLALRLRLALPWRWREDLNPRPTAYKAVALPLSYASTDKISL